MSYRGHYADAFSSWSTPISCAYDTTLLASRNHAEKSSVRTNHFIFGVAVGVDEGLVFSDDLLPVLVRSNDCTAIFISARPGGNENHRRNLLVDSR